MIYTIIIITKGCPNVEKKDAMFVYRYGVIYSIEDGIKVIHTLWSEGIIGPYFFDLDDVYFNKMVQLATLRVRI